MRVTSVARGRDASKPLDYSYGGAPVPWVVITLPPPKPHSDDLCALAAISRLNKKISAKDGFAKDSSSSGTKNRMYEYHRRFEEVKRVRVNTTHLSRISRHMMLSLSGFPRSLVASQTSIAGK